MHFCADELMALMAAVPFVGVALRRLHAWWHRRRCPHVEAVPVTDEEFETLKAAFDKKVEPNEALKKAFEGFCTDHGIRWRDCPVCSPVVEHVTK